MTATYYERRYCNQCLTVHWLEVTPLNREECHGEKFYPANTKTHYMRRSGKGFEMVERYHPATARQRETLPLAWQMARQVTLFEDIDP